MLRQLSNSELVMALDDIAIYSPIIHLLCLRLNEANDLDVELNERIECPVCAAPLLVSPDTSNNIYLVTIDKS